MTFNFLDLFNAVAASQKAITKDYIPATSLDVPISEDDLGLDSLDVTLTYVLLGDAYGVPTELEDFWPIESIGAVRDFIMEYKTQDPEDTYDSIDAVVRDLK